MKLLFCLLTYVAVVFSVSAQNQTEYKPSLHETVLHAVKNNDILLLKETLHEMSIIDQTIDVREILPLIVKEIADPFKWYSTLGVVALLFADDFKQLFCPRFYNPFWKELRNVTAKLLSLYIVIYLFYRKAYKMLNILIASDACCKTPEEIAFMKRLRRHCLPIVHTLREKCSLA